MLALTVIGVLSAVISVHGNGQIQDDFGRPVQVTKSTGAPWPKPQTMTSATDLYPLADPSSFRIYQKTQLICPVLDQAFARYYNIIFFGMPEMSEKKKMVKLYEMRQQGRFLNASLHHGKNLAALMGLSVSISTCSEMYPSLESSENYTLDVSEPFASLTADSQWGALRGLETFSQLIHESSLAMLVVNKTSITDFPRFAHRGFLVDSSRHFLPVDVLLQFLDAMAYNKFNVFHWHIVDDQSFPYQSREFPYLSQKGAFSQHHIYSQSDVKRVISYAQDRGIRVIPEFDTPGHTQSWGSAKDLLTPCEDKSGKPTGDYGPINPILNSTYEFLLPFFQEIIQVFPDNYIHAGGDEVNFDCWKSNKDIQSFMAQMGYGQNYSKLEAYYEKKFLGIVENLLAKPIVWQEVVDNGVQVNLETVVHVWKGPWPSELHNVTKKGYRTLLSTPWYLNLGGNPYSQSWREIYDIEPLGFLGGTDFEILSKVWSGYVHAGRIICIEIHALRNVTAVVPDAVVEVWKGPWEEEVAKVTHLGYRTLLSTPWYLNYAADPYVQDWKTFYSVEPLTFIGTAAQKALVFGGEACMWGEYVDATNVIQRSWPKGCAVAERLWSAENVHDVNEAAPRLAEQRCRMVRRGLKAEPVTGPGFCEFTGGN